MAMGIFNYMPVEDYTPHRLTECYQDINDEVVVLCTTGIDLVRLRGFGRMVWLMLDGKHTIGNIANTVFESMSEAEQASILAEVKIFLDMLQKKKLIIANWNPLHKMNLPQQIIKDECL